MTETVVQKTWDRMREVLRERLGEETFTKWIAKSRVLGLKRGVLSIGFEDANVRQWVQDQFGEALDRAAQTAFNAQVRVAVKVDPELFREAHPHPEQDHGSDEVVHGKRTLENFLELPGNKAAIGALQHVADGRRPRFNPLVIFGAEGCGKSHLAEAAGYLFAPKTQLLRVSGDDFSQRFTWSLKTRRIDRWRAECAGADLLILDDAHQLAGKKATQREFQTLVESISAHGGQTIVFLPTHPERCEGLEDGLRSLLLSGMLVAIESPDQEEKLAVLRKVLRHSMRRIPEGILEEIVGRVGGSVSRLERLVRKLYAFASLTGQSVDRRFLEEHLEEVAGPLDPGRKRTEAVFSVIESNFDVERDALLSKRKLKIFSMPRALIVFILREEAHLTFKEIGRILGGRSHTSVYLMYRKNEEEIRRDPRLSSIVKEAAQRLAGPR